MANTYQPEPADGGDSGVWGPKELKQNRLNLGSYSCRLYDDAGTLKITVGRIGFNNGSSQGAIDVDTVTSISLGASTSIWLKIEVSVSGSTPSFTATAIPAATDPGTIPAGFSGGFDNSKAGYYMIATARTIGLAWVNAAGALEGIINSYPGMEGYYGYSITDDALDQKYTWNEIAGLEYDGDYIGKLYQLNEDDRPGSAVLSAGSATTFTDVDFSAYVPPGVKAVWVGYQIVWTGDGALDAAVAYFRPDGSLEADTSVLQKITHRYTNLGAGLVAGHMSEMFIKCNSSGVIEYYVNDAAVDLTFYIVGYSL